MMLEKKPQPFISEDTFKDPGLLSDWIPLGSLVILNLSKVFISLFIK